MAVSVLTAWREMSLFLLVSSLGSGVLGDRQVPCYFVFGDSLSDVGNNNNLQTLAKVNYFPYGVDFPSGPNGRFSNGFNMVDFIAQFLGFKYSDIQPFVRAGGQATLNGVNYASGGAGILDESGKSLGQMFPMNLQLGNHKKIIQQINGILGGNSSRTNELLEKCLYTFAIGSNDYLNNYYMPELYDTSRKYTPKQFAQLLRARVLEQLETLFELGARKVAVIGVGVIGCTPYAKAKFGTNGSQCVDSINSAVQLFNVLLKSLVGEFNAKYTNALFTFIDSVEISATSQYAGLNAETPCCKVGAGQIQCTPGVQPCVNRKSTLFYDNVHPSEVVDFGFAQRAYKALTAADATPYDISHLAQIQRN